MTKKLFLWLPWIFHATELAWWDRPEICNRHGWDFLCKDYPTNTLILDDFLDDIIIFLENSSYDEIIICGISFGEIVAREILHKAPQSLQKRIKLHISVCGVSTFSELSYEKQRTVKLLYKVKYILWKNLLKKILQVLGKIENHWLRNNRCKHFLGKKNYMKHKNLSQQRALNIITAWSKWLTSSLYDRGEITLTVNHIAPISTPTIAIYAIHDPFFLDAKKAAEHILTTCTSNSQLICAHPWWHASIVELPETYNPILESILIDQA